MPGLFQQLRDLGRQLRFLGNQHAFERDLAEEMEFHLEERARELEQAGQAPAEARASARRRFGSVARATEHSRDAWTIHWIDTLVRDARYAVRSLGRSPGFAIVAILSLAVGLGATVAVFTMVNVALVKPLPYGNAERLAIPYRAVTPGMMSASDTLPGRYSDHLAFLAGLPAFESAAFSGWNTVNLHGPSGTVRIRYEQVSRTFFTTLGAVPLHGRIFDQTGSESAVVLAHDLWLSTFGGSTDAIGSTVRVGPAPMVVAGVMPPSFRGLTGGAQLWMPIDLVPLVGRAAERGFTDPRQVVGTSVALVRDGVSMEAASRAVADAAEALGPLFPSPPGAVERRWGAGLVPLREARQHQYVRPLLTLLAVAALSVLLLVSANIAGLALARARARESEFAARVALGVGRLGLVRQVMAECLVIAGIAAVPGALLAWAGAQALLRLRPAFPETFVLLRGTDLLAGASAAPDVRIILFAVGLVLLTGVTLGVAPALAAARTTPQRILNGARAAGGRTRGWAGLVVGQVALATALLVGAGLMLRSLNGLLHSRLGYDPSGVIVVGVSGDDLSPAAGVRRAELRERIAALPGVEGVASHGCSPFALMDCPMARAAEINGRVLPEGTAPLVEVHSVSPGYLHVMRQRLLEGGSAGGVWVNQAAARLLWPQGGVVGGSITLGDPGDSVATVTGVVEDTRYTSLDQPPRPAVYRREEWGTSAEAMMTLYIRSTLPAEELARQVRAAAVAADPGLAVFGFDRFESLVAEAASSRRFVSALLSVFAGIALFIATLGVYGVLAYIVRQRSRELGVRIALGATPSALLRQVTAEGARFTVLGLVIGLGVAIAGSRVLTAFLYEVTRLDVLAYGTAALAIGVSGLAASLIPAWRAAREDPAGALRE